VTYQASSTTTPLLKTINDLHKPKVLDMEELMSMEDKIVRGDKLKLRLALE
jgi:hypothetical protein